MPAPDHVVRTILALAGVLAIARTGGFLAERIRLPGVLGELAAGLLLGNLQLAGYAGLEFLKTDPAVDAVSAIAVIILLFHASLASTVDEMKRLALPAFLIAICGVAGSVAAAWGVTRWLLPEAAPFSRLFVAVGLSATSVGVSARVFSDLGRAHGATAHAILAAAVADDVLALLALAVLGASGALPIVLLKAATFLIGGLAVGMFVSPRLLSLASRSMSVVLLAAALAFCFAMAWLASVFGLAPVVGAFAAGLAVEEWHYQDFIDRRERTLDDLTTPVAAWLVPVFFVVIGLHTDLSGLKNPAVVGLAAALTAAAVLGKQLCAIGAAAAPDGVDRVAVALGMMPRGEVTLIFANIGLTMMVAGQPVISRDTFVALVITVIATTMVTPIALKWRLSRVSTAPRRSSASSADRPTARR